MKIDEQGDIALFELSEKYAQEMARLGDNPNIYKCVSDNFPTPYTIDKAKEFIELANSLSIGHIFAIEWKGAYAGNIGLHFKQGLERKSVELGYFIGEEYLGNGIATQAIKIICEYGLKHLDINRISASVMDFNLASMRALEKNGFEKEGVFKQALFKLGKFFDDHRYGKLK